MVNLRKVSINSKIRGFTLCMAAVGAMSLMASAADKRSTDGVAEEVQPYLYERADGRVVVGEQVFDSWLAYAESDIFRDNLLKIVPVSMPRTSV